MAQLKAGSERFTFQEELSLGTFLGAELPIDLILDGRGEASTSPRRGVARSGDPRQHAPSREDRRARTNGSTNRARANWTTAAPGSGARAAKERARPRSTRRHPRRRHAGARGTFTKLVEELDHAQSIVQAGPVTVEGQRVIEFDASLDPAPLVAELEAKQKPPRAQTASRLEDGPRPKRRASPRRRWSSKCSSRPTACRCASASPDGRKHDHLGARRHAARSTSR